MATAAILGASVDTTSGTHTVTATPTLNDLIVLLTITTGSTASTVPTDNQGGTYTTVASALKNTSADKMMIHVRNQLVSSAVSTQYSHAPGATTGGGIAVYRIAGMTRTGLQAIRQYAVQENQAAATPAPIFGTAALTGNLCLGMIFNATNPAAMTSPTSWTEDGDSGYNSPTTGYQVCRRNSGETGTTITWGSASGSAFCSGVVELDTTGIPDDNRLLGRQAVNRSNL